MGKRGQLFGMPFTMIFSIILIIFFIVAAWIGIKMFWCPWCCDKCSFSDQAEMGLFKDDLQTAIDEAWNSAGADSEFPIKLPSKIKRICFFDFVKPGRGTDAKLASEFSDIGQGNLYLYPVNCACEGFEFMTMKHLNITLTTMTKNPLCFENGKSLWIRSEHGRTVKIYQK